MALNVSNARTNSNGTTTGEAIGTTGNGSLPASKIARAKQIAQGKKLSNATITESDNYISQEVRNNTLQRSEPITLKTDHSVYRDPLEIPQNTPYAEQGASEEVASSPTNAEPEETKPLSPQFAALAKQRRALQVKERELAAREKAISNQSSSQDPNSLVLSKDKPLINQLLSQGITYDQLTQEAMNANSINPEVAELKAEIQSLRQGIEKTFSDKEVQQEQAVLAQMRKNASQMLREDTAGQYELVKAKNALPDVMKLIERTYRETGEVLDEVEALQEVENCLVDDSLRLTQLKKIQSRLQKSSSQQPQPQQNVPQMRTLTNQHNAQPQQLDRKARAMRAFYNKNKG